MIGLKKYLSIWVALVRCSFRSQMATLLGSAGYLVGKFLRFGFFLLYLVMIFRFLPDLRGYSMYEVILFFMTFNLIDVGTQFLFRGLYGVKYLIEEGDFDKILTQPAHPLFRISSMGIDLLDLLTLIPIAAMTIWTLSHLPQTIEWKNILLYCLLMVNALVISYAFHVVVGALSVRTQEFESAIWIYRDLMTLGRFPVSIYADVIRSLLVTALPIGIMVSFPADVLLGLLSWKGVLYALLIGGLFHVGAQAFWRNSLKEYVSNSS